MEESREVVHSVQLGKKQQVSVRLAATSRFEYDEAMRRQHPIMGSNNYYGSSLEIRPVKRPEIGDAILAAAPRARTWGRTPPTTAGLVARWEQKDTQTER